MIIYNCDARHPCETVSLKVQEGHGDPQGASAVFRVVRWMDVKRDPHMDWLDSTIKQAQEDKTLVYIMQREKPEAGTLYSKEALPTEVKLIPCCCQHDVGEAYCRNPYSGAWRS